MEKNRPLFVFRNYIKIDHEEKIPTEMSVKLYPSQYLVMIYLAEENENRLITFSSNLQLDNYFLI